MRVSAFCCPSPSPFLSFSPLPPSPFCFPFLFPPYQDSITSWFSGKEPTLALLFSGRKAGPKWVAEIKATSHPSPYQSSSLFLLVSSHFFPCLIFSLFHAFLFRFLSAFPAYTVYPPFPIKPPMFPLPSFPASSPPSFLLSSHFYPYSIKAANTFCFCFCVDSRPTVFFIWPRHLRCFVLDGNWTQGQKKGTYWNYTTLCNGCCLCVYPYKFIQTLNYPDYYICIWL